MFVLLHKDPEVDTVSVIAVSETADALRFEAVDDLGDELDGELEWMQDGDDEVALAGVYVSYVITSADVV